MHNQDIYERHIANQLMHLYRSSEWSFRAIAKEYNRLTGRAMAVSTVSYHFNSGIAPLATILMYLSIMGVSSKNFLDFHNKKK